MIANTFCLNASAHGAELASQESQQTRVRARFGAARTLLSA
jgi:hypothetical protein